MRIPEGPVVLLGLGRLGVESVEKEESRCIFCRASGFIGFG